MPVQDNGALNIADEVMSSLFNVAVQAAIKAAQAEVPFLALPVIGTIFSFIVSRIADMLYVQIERDAAFLIIDTQVMHENKAYQDALGSLRIAQSPGDKAKALTDVETALQSLIHIKSG